MRRRVGIIVPATNTVVEEELLDVASSQATYHIARTQHRAPFESDPAEFLDSIWRGVLPAAESLRALRLDCCGFFCTSAAARRAGPQDSRAAATVWEEAQRAIGCPLQTPLSALVDAARALGLQSVSLYTPYTEEIGSNVAQAIAGSGLNVKGAVHGLRDTDFEKVETSVLVREVAGAQLPVADALFISCTNLHTLEAIAILERATGRLVLSSNTLLFWRLGVGPGPPIRREGTTPRILTIQPPN